MFTLFRLTKIAQGGPEDGYFYDRMSAILIQKAVFRVALLKVCDAILLDEPQ